jgi:hypothetical protein
LRRIIDPAMPAAFILQERLRLCCSQSFSNAARDLGVGIVVLLVDRSG